MKAATDWGRLPLMLRLPEAAAVLRVSRTTVWRWAVAGDIPAVKVGRSWMVPRDALRDWTQNNAPVTEGAAQGLPVQEVSTHA